MFLKPGRIIRIFLGLMFLSSPLLSRDLCKAEIRSVSILPVRTGGLPAKKQVLRSRILTGPYQGRDCDIHNPVWSGHEKYYNLHFKPGDTVIARVRDEGPEGLAGSAVFPHRAGALLFSFAVFILLFLFLTRKKGIRALLALLFTFLFVGLFFIPGLRKGYSPVGLLLAVSFLSTAATMFFIAGVNHKSVSAAAGSMAGSVLALLFCVSAVRLLRITGFKTETGRVFSFFLKEFPAKNLSFLPHLISAGIVISALGAVMDLAIGIASSMNEMVRTNSRISMKELIAGGFSVGRDALTTMISTLVFAYSGGLLAFLLVFRLLAVPLNVVLSWEFIGFSFVTLLTGCVGMIMTLPCSVFFSGLMMKSRLPVRGTAFLLLAFSFFWPLAAGAWVEPPDIEFHTHPLTGLYQNRESDEYVKARFLASFPKDEKSAGMRIKIQEGTFRHRETVITRYFWGHPMLDTVLKPGEKFLLWLRKARDGTIKSAGVFDHYRNPVYFYLSLFVVVLFLLAGGIKAVRLVFAFLLTAGWIFFFLFPLLISGVNPLAAVLAAAFLIMLTLIFFIAGWSAKTPVALLAGALSVLTVFLVSLFLQGLYKINGSSIESLQLFHYYSCRVPGRMTAGAEGLLTAMIFMSLIGAVLDMVMTLTSALYELKRKTPFLSRKEFIKSGFTIGYDILGTMLNTLVLVFAGTELALFSVWSFTGFDPLHVFNQEGTALIVLKSLAGTAGMLLSVPAVVYTAAGFFYAKENPGRPAGPGPQTALPPHRSGRTDLCCS